jgi:hypothetical protein
MDSCASQKTGAEPTPLDIYLMLDISKSMVDTTTAGVQKWAAVKDALVAFLQDAGSSGLNVGIQYFPLRKPGVPTGCKSDAECGASGACFLSLCTAFPAPGVAQCGKDADCNIDAQTNNGPCTAGKCQANQAACTTDANCLVTAKHDFGPCKPIGKCESNKDLICTDRTTHCKSNGADLGACIDDPDPSYCFLGTVCESAGYATPAVELGALPGASAALVASLQAQVPNGDTPTGPALRGALIHAQAWAEAHPSHTVVAVLATDGLPTECVGSGNTRGLVAPAALLDDVVKLASSGVALTPSIPTFVIGVFGSADTGAPANLEKIAVAGGTQHAQIVDTGGNVTQQFQTALNAIRKTRLSCEFKIPPSTTGDALNYGLVNVAFTDGATTKRLGYIAAGAAGCDSEGGWYYDVPPNPPTSVPSKILVCPSNCSAFNNTSGSVQVELGCMTIPK